MHVKQDLEQNTWTPLKVTHCPVHTCVFYRLFRTITKSGPGVSVVLCIPRCLEWNKLVFCFRHFLLLLCGCGYSIDKSEISGFKRDLIDFHCVRFEWDLEYQIRKSEHQSSKLTPGTVEKDKSNLFQTRSDHVWHLSFTFCFWYLHGGSGLDSLSCCCY